MRSHGICHSMTIFLDKNMGNYLGTRNTEGVFKIIALIGISKVLGAFQYVPLKFGRER